jgi:Fe-S cluster assembly scaffold protein SufB
MSDPFYKGGWECPECGKAFDESQLSSIWQHKYNRHGLDTENYIERYRRVRQEIPEKYRGTYETVTGEGKSPAGFQAAVAYIESEVSQATIKEAFDVSEVTIREHVRRIIREGVVSLEYVQANSPHDGSKVFNGKDGMCAGQEVKHGI